MMGQCPVGVEADAEITRSFQESLPEVDVLKLQGLITLLIRCELQSSRRANSAGLGQILERRTARGES